MFFKKFLKRFNNDPSFQYKIHVGITGLWLATIIPTIIWWRNSVLWVAFLSIYANVISQWTCARAIKAEIEAKKSGKNVEVSEVV